MVCLPLGQHPRLGQPRLDFADLLLVESAGAVFAVAGDKGNGVPLVEQLDDRLHLIEGNLQSTYDVPQINRHHTGHRIVAKPRGDQRPSPPQDC